jgi:hypothetical protein
MDGARGLLARRVRAVSARLPQPAFPGFHPVTRCLVLAHSCAAARDSHPLPILITRPVASGDKDARTDETLEKDLNDSLDSKSSRL